MMDGIPDTVPEPMGLPPGNLSRYVKGYMQLVGRNRAPDIDRELPPLRSTCYRLINVPSFMFDLVIYGNKVLCPEDKVSNPYSCVSAISIPTRYMHYERQDKPRRAKDKPRRANDTRDPAVFAANIKKLEESASDRRKRDWFIKLIQSLGGSLDRTPDY